MKSAHTTLVSIFLILVLSTTAFHSSCSKPEDQLAMLRLVLDALNLPDYQLPEANVGRHQDSCVLIIEDFEGRLLAKATWDGCAPRISADGKVWVFNLSALLENHQVEYELGISIEDRGIIPEGSAVLTVRSINGPKIDSGCIYTLRLQGFDCVISDNGRLAAFSPDGAKSDGLSKYLAAVAQMGKCRFQLGLAVSTVEEPGLITVSSESTGKKGLDESILIEILFVSAQSWTSEHVLGYADAIENAKKAPDIRILGVSDKAAVRPGENVRYTYFLFNAGTESAVDIALTIPLPAEVAMLPDSLIGGKLGTKIVQQEADIQVPSSDVEVTSPDIGEKIIKIFLTEEIIPGEAVIVEFSVTV